MAFKLTVERAYDNDTYHFKARVGVEEYRGTALVNSVKFEIDTLEGVQPFEIELDREDLGQFRDAIDYVLGAYKGPL